MRFQVPQFIEVEDKIFWSLTFKQFVYLAGSIAICVILFTLLPRFLAIIIGLPILAFGLALTFFKYNGKPFIYTVEAFLKFAIGSKLYIWKKEDKVPQKSEQKKEAAPEVYVPKLSDSKLKDLSWSLDIQGNQNPVTPNEKE